MIKIGILCAALACTWSAHAGESIHKCSSGNGTSAYRSQSCRSGETLVAVIEPAPGVVSAGLFPVPLAHRPVSAAARHAEKATVRRIRGGSRRHASRPRHSRKDPCKSAKQARDDYQRRRGIRITMDDLSRWNHRVYDACK